MGRDQWEICWKDYYRLIGVNMFAEPEVIKAAYSSLARKHHPDAGGSTDRMKGINEAYEVLSDPAKKARYDADYYRRYSQQGAQSSGQEWNSRERQAPRRTAARLPSFNEVKSFRLSLGWQRFALIASFPVGLLSIFLIPSPAAIIAGIAIVVAAGYACIKTRFLTSGRKAGIVARFSGGFAIISTLCVMGVIAATIAALLATGFLLCCAMVSLICRR